MAARQATQTALKQYKMEAAKELGISLNDGKKLTRQQAGQIGGRVVKKMVAAYENSK
ncbi:MAG: alpha/beta-type small acid-soluble spore protein [Oscillospiraceae bacterium]|nr:alpha/beta-type small acid-soluble spore protein [Oscillospiraceae bacterium]